MYFFILTFDQISSSKIFLFDEISSKFWFFWINSFKILTKFLKNGDFWPNFFKRFLFLANSLFFFIFDQISIFWINFYTILTKFLKNADLWPNFFKRFWFLANFFWPNFLKILTFSKFLQNVDFWPNFFKIYSFWRKFRFLTKVYFFRSSWHFEHFISIT